MFDAEQQVGRMRRADLGCLCHDPGERRVLADAVTGDDLSIDRQHAGMSRPPKNE
ncbi:hypothetical protein [Streptosporangium sp. NPDC001681]|uniref:hypothetical protein n=1 Tax=Streptosporangium sp. NPDC001681 TaxID=3154395 RepID=UPI00331D3BD5